MRFSLKSRFSGIATLLIYTLEVLSASKFQNDTDPSNISELTYNTKNSTNIYFNNSSISSLHDVSNRNISAVKAITNPNIALRKQLRKHKRRKIRRNRRQHKAVSTTESSLLKTVGNQTEPNPKIKRKRKRKLKKKRKNRKNRRRQQKLENTNILEVTTAKEMIFPTNKNLNSTINELIRKLNENPEDNFDSFRIMHSNKTNTLKMKGENVANLVAPVPTSSKFTTVLHNNITLHISIGNNTNHKTSAKRNNRCRKNKGGCAHFCNPKGKIKCSCLKGFALAADQRTCLDIDECKQANGGCEKECHNTLGSFECRCPNGLRLDDDLKSCQDINECLLRNGHGPCQDTCENTFGSYKCNCKGLNGTVLDDDGHTCLDINECATDNGGCSHECINTLGRVFCSCPDGMELSSDWKTCQDINECEDENMKTSCKNCINTEGSYQCLDTVDYQSDQPLMVITCKPLPLPAVGFISCSRDDAQKSYAKTGRERIMNTPGTICKLVCPVGFRMVGHFYVACGSFGKWEGKTEAKCIRVEAPTILCPSTQSFTVNKKSKKALVKFPSPSTNINWKYVKSYPSWGKDLSGLLEVGHYEINFVARDPNSKLSASCTFKINVED